MGGERGCGAFGVIRFGSSNFGYPSVAGSQHSDDLFFRGVARGSRFKGTQSTSAGASYTGNDLAYRLRALLDPLSCSRWLSGGTRLGGRGFAGVLTVGALALGRYGLGWLGIFGRGAEVRTIRISSEGLFCMVIWLGYRECVEGS